MASPPEEIWIDEAELDRLYARGYANYYLKERASELGPVDGGSFRYRLVRDELREEEADDHTGVSNPGQPGPA